MPTRYASPQLQCVPPISSLSSMSAAQRLPNAAASSFKSIRKYFHNPVPPALRLPPLRASRACSADQPGARYLSRECEDAYKHLLVSELLKPASRNANETAENGESPRSPGSEPPREISDQEWEIRTGESVLPWTTQLKNVSSRLTVECVRTRNIHSTANAARLLLHGAGVDPQHL